MTSDISREQQLTEIASAEVAAAHTPAQGNEISIVCNLPHGSHVSGYMELDENGNRVADLEWVGVPTALRGNGIGERLVGRFASKAKEIGAQALHCTVINPAVVRIAEKVFGEENVEFYEPTAEGPVSLPMTAEQAKLSVERGIHFEEQAESGGILRYPGFDTGVYFTVDLDKYETQSIR